MPRSPASLRPLASAADAALACQLNALAWRSAAGKRLVGLGAARLATLDVGLMFVLAVGGRPRAALRMLVAVSLVYALSELGGRAWPRPRPFARLDAVVPVVPHTAHRSFPSRHVASAMAMALIALRYHPRLGWMMLANVLLLALTRVAAGLHYPSDVLTGVALGAAVALPLRGQR